jgi:hypothetical protein
LWLNGAIGQYQFQGKIFGNSFNKMDLLGTEGGTADICSS